MRCRTRQKLDSALFVHLNQQTVTDSYTLSADDQSLDGWHGHRLRGADGTLLNVPDTPETRRVFSVAANQHTAYVQAAAVVLYDLGNAGDRKPITTASNTALKSSAGAGRTS